MTREALALPGWEEHLARLRIDPPAWLRKNAGMLSRRTFLEWLKESTDSQTWTRGADGNHFYGKAHLLIYAQMTGQTWSHLILTGLNEGVWPRVFEAGAFGSRHELAALNQQARELNRLGAGQGGQGMGHETVGADRGHCLLPLERQDLALRDLCAALESTGAAACLTAMTTEGGRSLLPSDFFNHAYQAKTGRVLDEETFRSLANATEDMVPRGTSLFSSRSHPLRLRPSRPPKSPTPRGAIATQPFGPYEFAYAQPPRQPIQLSCKTMGGRVEPSRHRVAGGNRRRVALAGGNAELAARGRHLGPSLAGRVAARMPRAKLGERFFAVAARSGGPGGRSALRNRARAAEVELYPWWDQVWAQARTMALGLGETLAPHLQDKQFLSEFRLPQDVMIALPGTDQADFLLKGRIDLLLVEPGAIRTRPCARRFFGLRVLGGRFQNRLGAKPEREKDRGGKRPAGRSFTRWRCGRAAPSRRRFRCTPAMRR